MGWTTAIDNNLADAVTASDSRWTNWKTLTDNQSCTNDNYGLQYAIAYKVTGTTSYCDTAFSNNGGCNASANRNKTRDCFVERALAYSICGDVVSAGNKTTWETDLDAVTSLVQTGVHGTRVWDTDELMGHYFGCSIYDLAKDGTYDQCLVNGLGASWGGIDATATDRTTIRNAVKYYWDGFSDGTFVEGTEYNKNTIYYTLLGVHALNDFYGADKFPEITTLYDEIADFHLNYSTPDYSQHFQFGDVQNGQQDNHNRYRTLAMYSVIAHLDSDDAGMTALRNSVADSASNCVRMPWIMFYNHDATASNPGAQSAMNAAESGIAFWHEDWNTNDTFFSSQLALRFDADHDWNNFANMTVWRNDGHAIDFPKHYYGNEHNAASFMNGVLVNGGFSAMYEATKQIAYEAGSDYMYHAGVTSGFYSKTTGDYDAPPPWIDEYTVQRLFHNNADGTETIFDFHRIDACRPNSTDCMSAHKLSRLAIGSYGGASYTKADAASWNHIYVLNTGASPSKASDLFSWTADNGDTMELHAHIDSYTNSTVTMANESQNTSPYYFTAQGFTTSEMNDFQLRLAVLPSTTYSLTPMMTAIHIGASADSYVEITDGGGNETARGIMVENATDRVVAIFNATDDVTTTFTSTFDGSGVVYDANRGTKAEAMSHFKDSGSVSFTTDDTKDIQVYILGLDHSFAWTIQKNGGASGCTVTDQGVCAFTITGAAQAHTVSWSVGGAVTCDDLCSVCSTQGNCEGSALTCYWHNNDGATASQCNDSQSASQLCSGNPGACQTQDACETNNYCWNQDVCLEECTSPGTTITIYANEDAYISEDANTTNYNGSGLQVRSSTGGGSGSSPDLSTFTTGGTNVSDISVSSSRATATGGLLGSEDAYVYDDYGTDNFGEVDIDFTVNTQYQGSSGLIGVMCLSNTSGANMGGMNDVDDGICLQYGRSFTPDGIRIRDYENTTSASTVIALSGSATTYYGTFTISGTTATINMYTDSGRTTHTSGSPQTLTVNSGTTQKYRHFYVLASGGTDGAGSNSAAYMEDFTINQADAGGGGSSTDLVTLLEFDLSTVPAGSDITNANLEFVHSAVGDGNTGSLQVFKGLRDFNESQTTWDNYSTGNAWTTGGARSGSDMEGTWSSTAGSLGAYTVTGVEAADSTNIFIENASLITYLEANIGGTVYLYINQTPTVSGSLVQMYDSENATVTNRPRLDITYAEDTTITPPVLSPKRSVNGGKINIGRWGG